MQAQAQALPELLKHSLKARTPKTYFGKSHIDCYHFCQQYKDYFKTSNTIGMNHILFAAAFFCGSIRLRWAQYKRCYKCATIITWSKFTAFLQKNFGSS